MKLIIQIPCYNEEQTLPVTLRDLPRELPGISSIEWLVIDDGSTDNTVQVARKNGVHHIVSNSKNLGLAKTFMKGLQTALELGADIIVNTDADNQYRGSCVKDLVAPIIAGNAEMVIGARPIFANTNFSFIKKILQSLGSWTVRLASNSNIPDAPSGFRAFSREAAIQLNVYNNYTYTLETIIQAGQKNIPMTWVPIEINEELRPSRLFKSIPSYILKSTTVIIRMFVVYRPFRFFMSLGMVILTLGLLLGMRFLYIYITGSGSGNVQSLILTGILIGVGFQTMLTAFVVDLISVNRKLLEELLRKSRSTPKDTHHTSKQR